MRRQRPSLVDRTNRLIEFKTKLYRASDGGQCVRHVVHANDIQIHEATTTGGFKREVCVAKVVNVHVESTEIGSLFA